jgi:hypothetical protein
LDLREKMASESRDLRVSTVSREKMAAMASMEKRGQRVQRDCRESRALTASRASVCPALLAQRDEMVSTGNLEKMGYPVATGSTASLGSRALLASRDAMELERRVQRDQRGPKATLEHHHQPLGALPSLSNTLMAQPKPPLFTSMIPCCSGVTRRAARTLGD